MINYCEYESRVLGSLLGTFERNKTVESVLAELNDKDFRNSKNKFIFKAICDVFASGETTDAVNISTYLQNVGRGDLIDHLMKLTTILPHSGASVHEYIDKMKDIKILEETVAVAEEIIQDSKKVYDIKEFVTNIPSKFKMPVLKSKTVSFKDMAMDISKGIDDYYAGNNIYFPVGGKKKDGMHAIDAHFGGGIQSGFYIIGARTNVGKTEVAADIALSLAENGYNVRYDQLELTPKVFYEKLVAKLAGGTRGQLVQGLLDRQKVEKAQSDLYNLSIKTTTQAYTVNQARLMIEKEKPDVWFIDQFDKIIPDGQYSKNNYLQALNEIVQGVFKIHKDFDIPVFMLAQLNRESEKRAVEQKEPVLSDLKNTGDLEQTADVVMLLHRPNKGKADDYMQIHIAKDRLMDRNDRLKFIMHGGRLVDAY